MCIAVWSVECAFGVTSLTNDRSANSLFYVAGAIHDYL